MSDLKNRLSGGLDEQDKQQLKAGAKSCYTQFVHFVDKFTEMIFSKYKKYVTFFYTLFSLIVIALISAAVWDTCRTTNWFGSSNDAMSNSKILNFIVVGYYLICAATIFLSWKNNETVL